MVLGENMEKEIERLITFDMGYIDFYKDTSKKFK